MVEAAPLTATAAVGDDGATANEVGATNVSATTPAARG